MSINAAIERARGDAQHKQRMDRMYKVQRHFYDVTRACYLLGRNACIAALKPPAGGSVLEIGCGTGRNLVQLSRTYPDATIYGVDISDEMLLSSVNSVERHGLRHRVKLAQGDATIFDGQAFGKPHYDRVLFSYTLSMIPGWERALRTAAERLLPGGEVHIVDFGPCDRLPAPAKALLYAWLNQFHVMPRLSLSAECARLARSKGLRFDHKFSHRGYVQRVVLSKH